ncbi:MAG: RpiB/LacA/LacB family sugar-phosphate isomerase [Gemmatimonadaceae bacterium]
MRVAFGCDHAGWPLRARILAELQARGAEVVDCGPGEPLPGDDYPDVAAAVGRAVVSGAADRGVLVCGSGVGASIAASKLTGVRCALCHDPFSARQGVEDDDMNVMALGARVIGPELAAELLRDFLEARFSGADRHRRRLAKIAALECDRE